MKFRFKIILLLLFLPLPMLNIHLASAAYGNSVSTAIYLIPNTVTNGTVSATSSIWYNVSINTPDYYVFNLSSSVGNQLTLNIHLPNGTISSSSSTFIYPEQLSLTLSLLGNYSIEIMNVLVTSASFSVAYFPNSGINLQNARYLPLNTVVNGTMPNIIDYNFTISTPGYYAFSLNGSSSTAYSYYITNSKAVSLGSPANQNYPEPLFLNLSVGNYSFLIFDNANPPSIGVYSISVNSHIIQPGEDIAHAIPIPLNTTKASTMPNQAFFNVSIVKNEVYDFNLSTALSNMFYFNVYDNKGSLINYTISTNYPENLYLNLTPGNYYIKVWSYYGSGPFQIGFYVYSPRPGQDLAHAIPLLLDTPTPGSMPITQYFNFTALNSGFFVFNLTTPAYPSQFSYNVYSGNGVLLGSSTSYNMTVGGGGIAGTSCIFESQLNAGSYYVRVSLPLGYNTGQNLFNMTVHLIQPGVILQTAFILPFNTTTPGNIQGGSGSFIYEYYNFTITTSGEYTVSLGVNDPTNNMGIEIHDSNGITLAYSLGTPKSATANLTAGNYYVRVLSDPYYAGPNNGFNLYLGPHVPIPGENLANAINVPINTVVKGNFSTVLNSNGTFSAYLNFTISKNAMYVFNVSITLSTYLDVAIYDSTGKLLNETTVSPSSISLNAPPSAVNFAENITTGSYYIVATTNFLGLNYQVSYAQYEANSGGTNQSTSSQSTGTGKATTTISAPFSPIYVIISSLVALAVVNFIRRRKY